jgi:phosphoglycerate dehydrogenase-like enzyme
MQRDLHGKTLGIIGLGSIGGRVARIAQAFKMRVLAYDPHLSAGYVEEIGAKLVSLEILFRESDFVTIHTVLTEETKGLVGLKELHWMKSTAYLINTSRGLVLDQKALIKVLKEKRIAGAGLDVFTCEPIHTNDPLLGLDNVIVSPHFAGNSLEALEDISLAVSKEVVRILQGRVPISLVNRTQLEERKYL